MQAQLDGAPGVPWRGMAFQSGEWIILGGLTLLVYGLAMRFPLRGAPFPRNLAIHTGGALALCVFWASLGILLRAVLGTLPTDVPLARYSVGWMLISLPWSVFMYFTVLGCVFAFTFAIEARERETTAALLSAQVAAARLDALRTRLHPHFLFNSLNAVAVLVRDGRNTDARHVIEQLSEMLRELLPDRDARDVPLAREMEFVRKYLSIEEMRFSDRLKVHWQVTPDALAALVPSLIMQPLVENALRHGVAAISAPSTIEITALVDAEELRLGVVNDAPDPSLREQTRGRGVGLASTRERLATLFGDRASLSLTETGGRVQAAIRMPYRRAADADGESR
jgi:hypothetical protein